MQLHEVVRKEIEASPDESDDAMAERLLAHVDQADHVKLFAAFIRTERRALANALERSSFLALWEAPKDGAGLRLQSSPLADSSPEFQALFRESFAVGDGTRTTWGKATPEQHDIRAAFLEAQAAGTLTTARRHRWTAAALREVGASCLEESQGIAIPVAV